MNSYIEAFQKNPHYENLFQSGVIKEMHSTSTYPAVQPGSSPKSDTESKIERAVVSAQQAAKKDTNSSKKISTSFPGRVSQLFGIISGVSDFKNSYNNFKQQKYKESGYNLVLGSIKVSVLVFTLMKLLMPYKSFDLSHVCFATTNQDVSCCVTKFTQIENGPLFQWLGFPLRLDTIPHKICGIHPQDVNLLKIHETNSEEEALRHFDLMVSKFVNGQNNLMLVSDEHVRKTFGLWDLFDLLWQVLMIRLALKQYLENA